MDGCAPSPQPSPRSPPDLYGRRREFAEVQMLEREIGFLQEELKSVEGFQPASRCCKEVVDFLLGNSDPLIPTYQNRGASCGFWKWLCGISWPNFSSICCCCYAVCPPDPRLPCCCTCDSCIHIPKCCCYSCSFQKWPFSSCCHRQDCSRPNRHCSNCFPGSPCGGNSSCCCFSRPKCPRSCNGCSCLNGLCCNNPCY